MLTRNVLFFAAFLALLPVVVACSSTTTENQVSALEEAGFVDIKRGTLDDAARRAFEVGIDTPYQNPQFSVVENDGTFASVAVEVELRETSNSAWTPNRATLDCKQIGELWQCETNLSFSPMPRPTSTRIGPQATPESAGAATQEPAVLPTPTVPPPPMVFYVQNVQTGPEGRQRVEDIYLYMNRHFTLDPPEGWQWLTFDLIYENNTTLPMRIDSQHISGVVVDAGGYEHGVSVPFPDGVPLLPRVRYRLPFHVKIPQNQTPGRFEFMLGSDIQAWVDLTAPDDQLAVPFDQPPADIASAPDVLEYTVPQSFIARVDEFELTENMYDETSHYVSCDVTFENLGGHDLTSVSADLPRFVGVTDRGMPMIGGFSLGQDVPPGYTKEGLCSIGGHGGGIEGSLHVPHGNHWTDFDWVWLTYMHPNYPVPVYQFILAPDDSTNVPEIPSPPSIAAGSMTPTDLDEAEYRQRILATMSQLDSFRATTYELKTGTVILSETKTSGDYHAIIKHVDGSSGEILFVGGTRCFKHGTETWDCREDDYTRTAPGLWRSIIEGNPYYPHDDFTVIGQNVRPSQSADSRPCLRYSTTYSDGDEVLLTMEICFDLESYLPIEGGHRAELISGAVFAEEITVYTDFNAPLTIELPETQ